MPLTDQQERFCLEYVVDFNAAQAAIRAGYAPDSARQQGSRLLTNDDIVGRVSELRTEGATEVKLTREFVIRGLMNQALFGGVESAKVRAYELLGKHLAMFTDRLEVTQISKDALEAEIERLERELVDD